MTMARRERVPGPSRGQFCQCGWETPVIAASMTMLDVAEHQVHHLETQPSTRSAGLVAAYRTLVGELRALERRQRARIVDLEETLAATEWDLKVTSELVDDLKADLAAIEEGRHA
jgi:hypothetical protein